MKPTLETQLHELKKSFEALRTEVDTYQEHFALLRKSHLELQNKFRALLEFGIYKENEKNDFTQ